MAQHANPQVDRRIVQHHEIDRSPEHAFEFSFDGEARRIECRRLGSLEQDGHVDVAVSPRIATGRGPEQIHRQHVRARLEDIGDVLQQRFHGEIIVRESSVEAAPCRDTGANSLIRQT